MKKFAVFDIDGTLIRWQLYHAVVDRLAKKNLLGPDARERLHDSRMVWKRREHLGAFGDYEKALIAIYEEALPELSAKQFDNVAEEVVSEYKAQVYTYTRELAKRLKKQGYTLIAISGSHQELVGHVSRIYDFDYWVGTRYERQGDRFTGKKFVASKDKKIVLSNLVKKHGLTYEGSWGVGDSKSDAAFLDMVDHPIAFNPDLELFDIAKGKRWQIVIERKNVNYKLKSGHDGYTLA